MAGYRYRLTPIGWIGAVLFVLPTPLAIWEWNGTMNRFANRSDFDRRLESMSGTIAVPEVSLLFFTALATASLIGLVMLLVGREMVER